MSLSNTYETHVLNYLFTATSVTRPTSFFLALFTADPGEASISNECSTSGTAYARQAIAFTVSNNLATNSGAIEFPVATGSGFGTVTHLAVCSASTGDNIIASSALTASKAIGAGDVFRLPVGDLDITLE